MKTHEVKKSTLLMKTVIMHYAISIKMTILLLLSLITFSCTDDDNQPPEENPTPKTVTVSTLAGSGISGDTNSTGASAQFNYPAGVAVDASGTIYIADGNNHKIKKISPQGEVSTLAGSGIEGDVNGSSTSAQFRLPAGVAVDGDGNIYVADGGNNKIKKITPNGEVSTLAGSGEQGQEDGNGADAQFEDPVDVAVDASGNIYVADSDNNKIRKITPNGNVTTLAGSGDYGFVDGTSGVAQFTDPQGVAVDASGNVYVADQDNNRIRKVTPNGVVSTVAGNGGTGYVDGEAASAQFDEPQDVAVDASGNVYVLDLNDVIRKITPQGMVNTWAGNGISGDVDGEAASAQFNAPIRVTIDVSGNFYVADYGNHKIRKIVQQ